jgi:hypothetical protein
LRSQIKDLLLKRWIPALNEICSYVGYGEKEATELTEASLV